MKIKKNGRCTKDFGDAIFIIVIIIITYFNDFLIRLLKNLCRHFRSHLEDVSDLAWSSNSQKLLSASVDKSVIVWDVVKGYFGFRTIID